MIPYGCEVCPDCGEVICELCAAEPHNVHAHGDHGVTLRLAESEADDLRRLLEERAREIRNFGGEYPLGRIIDRIIDARAYWLESTAGGEG